MNKAIWLIVMLVIVMMVVLLLGFTFNSQGISFENFVGQSMESINTSVIE